MLLHCRDLISSLSLFFLSFFFFLPPLYFLSLFSFRLNVNFQSGGEGRQPAIPHTSLLISVPSSQISTLFSLPLPSRSCCLSLLGGLAGRKGGSHNK